MTEGMLQNPEWKKAIAGHSPQEKATVYLGASLDNECVTVILVYTLSQLAICYTEGKYR